MKNTTLVRSSTRVVQIYQTGSDYKADSSVRSGTGVSVGASVGVSVGTGVLVGTSVGHSVAVGGTGVLVGRSVTGGISVGIWLGVGVARTSWITSSSIHTPAVTAPSGRRFNVSSRKRSEITCPR